MTLDYLNEAFKRLDLLDEDLFNTDNTGINELSDFMTKTDVDKVRVIDADAKTEDDLQTSYIGKVIIDCHVCHSHIFKNKEDIEIDDNGDVNITEECPYCGEQEGFVVVGEICPFNKEEEVEPNDSTETTVEEPSVEEEPSAVETPIEESLTESVNNVNVETDDTIVNVATEDDGKVTVTTEPKVEETVIESEVIAPVSDETMDELTAEEPVSEEPPVEEGEAEESTDFEIDEIDEESIDELGESYLKRVYENVDSFKTTTVSTNDRKMVVEGVITFKSGTTKNTGFLFEAKDATKTGKVRFIGENRHLAKGAKAFTLIGRINENKLISESFSYNYRTKNSKGLTEKVHGTVKRSK